LDEILELMKENLNSEWSNDSNLRLWFQAARRSTRIDIDQAIQYMKDWYARSGSIDPLYYVYVLYTIKAMVSPGWLQDAVNYQRQCNALARRMPNRTVSYDWIGQGVGMEQLIHYQRIGIWDEQANFWRDTRLLRRLHGRIASIEREEAGWIELESGIKAFFVPARRRGTSGEEIVKGRDENKRVTFFLGFSYDGPRAWSVILEPSVSGTAGPAQP
jgi:hypothetical protein